MDGFKGKRICGPIMPRKTSGLVLHENKKKKDDKIVPICSRIGCSSRISSTKGSSFDHKTKSNESLFPSPSNGKLTIGSSSRSIGCTKKNTNVSCRRQLTSVLDTDSSDSSSVHENSVSEEVVTEAGSSSRGTGRSIHQRPDSVTRDPRVYARASVNRHGLRDLRSKSVSDVTPSNSNPTRTRNIYRKKNTDEESSSSNREHKTNDRPVIKVRNQRSLQGNAITMSESSRNRNLSSVLSSSNTRSSGYYGRTGRSGAVATLQAPLPATRVDLNPSRTAEVSNTPSNSYSRPISRSNGRLRPCSPSETSLSRSLMNHDSFRHYNMNGVSEVLLALEMIEQDQELTYEQLVALETNLFLNNVNSFHDQHRDMRLDIDNMSYEELLELEEKMGSVSTALTEEALLKSLKSTIYRSIDESGGIFRDKEDDVKCSICQEEYVDEDEVGTLCCQHMYHLRCVQQWLRMKNWCPICKSSAESKSQLFS